MAQDLHQVPPGAEVWEVKGTHYIVYFVPNTNPPVPLAWHPQTVEEREALGIDIKNVDRRFASWDEFYATGVLKHGNASELLNTTENPFDQILSNYKTEVKVKPWLADPEVLGLWAAAALEGRSITDAELQGTEWWRSHTETERQWLSMNAADPASADQLIADNRLRVADLFKQAGVANADDALVQLVADNWTTGAWSEVYATNQIRLLADPAIEGALDPQLKDAQEGLDTTRGREDTVRQMAAEWLGPGHGLSDVQVAKWAGRLRNDPDAIQAYEDFLRRQFQTHWNPKRQGERAYGDDPNLTYADIAAPWKNVFQQMWGQQPDETSSIFADVVRGNDLSEAQKMLRTEGLRVGNGQVVQSIRDDMSQSFGGPVRRSDPAIL